MEDYRQIIANNICELRKQNKMTQSELAEKLHYSDKAISRWERGDTMPSIEILCSLCELFGVELNYLVSNNEVDKKKATKSKAVIGNKVTIMLLAISFVWLLATCIYVYAGIQKGIALWIVFIWAIPVTALVADTFNMIWGKRIYSIITRSVFIWSLLASFYIQFLKYNIWLVFLLGIPMQVCIILWCRLK